MDSDRLSRRASDPPPRLPATRPTWLLALVALLLGLAVTVALATWQRARARANDERQLAALADSQLEALRTQLRQYGLVLRAMQSAFLVTPVDAESFSRVYANLSPEQRLPGMRALVYVVPVRLAGGQRFTTLYVLPAAGNDRVRGLDVASQPANVEALLRSRDTGRAALSAPFRLVQDPPGHAPDGLLMRMPVYSPGPVPATTAQRRARFVGSLGVSFRISAMARTAFRPEGLRELRTRIEDVGGGGRQLVFDSHPGQAVTTDGWSTSETVELGGRRWTVSIHDARGHAGIDGLLPLLLGGALGSVAFALWIASISTSRQRAVEMGEMMSRRYRDSEARFRAVNELLPALVLLVREDTGRVSYANRAARLRLGEDIGQARLADLFEDPRLRTLLEDPSHGDWDNVEALLCSTNGDRFWANVSVARIEVGGLSKKLVVATDISQQRQLTELLTYQASHDVLTELFNRREFERHVERALVQVAAGGPACALLFVDLDQFKLINDTSGHAAGDQLLAQLASVMRGQLRGGDVLARLGGDEFGVLACDVHDEAGTRLVAERVRQHIDGYVFVWGDVNYNVSASIGAVLLEPGDSLKELFAQADTACYLAKEGGRNRVHVYSRQDDAATSRRTEMEWANRLRLALEEDRLRLFYQQVVPLRGPAAGAHVELLLRLVDEDGRMVPPGAFIPAAERYGLMPAIDRWVVQTALANFDRLHPDGAALGSVAINLSGASVDDEALVELILELIARHGVDPRRLCFEITETVAVRNLAEVSRFAARLRTAGCRIALDDFGVGMSSFGYLKNLPVDVIKIDGSFVRDLLGDPMSHAIVRAVTDIGHQRGMQVVAEWVDSETLLHALQEIGVDHAQGFFLHRPEPARLQPAAR